MARRIGTNLADTLNGTNFSDILNGLGGNDRISGLAGNDDIEGGSGNDSLFGGEGRDDLEGDAGNDLLDGGTGNDTLDGGRGDDRLTGGAGNDIFEFERGDGRDSITDFRNGEDRIQLDGFTTAAIQSLINSAQQVGPNVVLNLSRDTSITLQNVSRTDLDLSDFVGQRGSPVTPPAPPQQNRDIDGTNADNTLTGGAGNDDIDGFGGNDRLTGAGGNDDLDGGSGNDSLFGGDGRDDLDGGTGTDLLEGGAGNDTLDGGRGNDRLTGGAGADLFEFERGDGRDLITDFRNGEDRIELDGFSAQQVQTIISGARQQGNDVVLTLSPDSSVTLQNFTLSNLDASDFAGVRLPTSTPPARPEQPSQPSQPERGREIDGTSAANTLNGGAGNDEIDGYGGDDRLFGNGGNDEIDGGTGNDSLFGGDGNDDLAGELGNDRIEGGAGNDTLEGGRGNDILIGGAGADVFEFERGDGRDTISDFTNGVDLIDLDDFTFAQATAVISGAQQVGADLVLTLSADTTITITNMQRAQLDMSDFIL